MRDVELWEAVALSIDMEPGKLPIYLGAYEAFGDDPFRICPNEFLERLKIANSNGGISLPLKPVHTLKARCLVDLPTFSAWAVNLHINIPPELVAMAETKPVPVPVVPTEPQDAPVVAVVALGGNAWTDKARKRAVEIIERQRLIDCYPSQVAIGDEIAKEFRRDGVMGADGKPIAGSYIKRHALNGISSAQVKQLSTQTRRGK